VVTAPDSDELQDSDMPAFHINACSYRHAGILSWNLWEPLDSSAPDMLYLVA